MKPKKKQNYIFVLSTLHRIYNKDKKFMGHGSGPVYWDYTFKAVEKVLLEGATWYHDGWNCYAVIERLYRNHLLYDEKDEIHWYKFVSSTPGILIPGTEFTMKKIKRPKDILESSGFHGFNPC